MARIDIRDVLGARTLPPPWVARAVEALRAQLARVHRGLAPPPVRILESALASLDTAVLAVLCHLEVPDHLDDAVPIGALAATIGADEPRLSRLLRYAAAKGWVAIDRRDQVRPTAVTRFLRRDHPGGWRAWVEFAGGAEVAAALGALDAAVTPDGDPFATGNGTPFFDWMREHPGRHATFDAAMDAGGRMHGLVLSRALDWTSSRRVCDVGGGTGALLGVLLAEQPHLEGVLLDLPEVVARARPLPRLTAVPGDAFSKAPGGCDTYLLVNVVHDWPDDEVVELLTVIRRAATDPDTSPSGVPPRVLVVEHEPRPREREGLASATDLLMLALTPGGQQRTATQIARLAALAGLELTGTVQLPTGGSAHVLVPGTRHGDPCTSATRYTASGAPTAAILRRHQSGSATPPRGHQRA